MLDIRDISKSTKAVSDKLLLRNVGEEDLHKIVRLYETAIQLKREIEEINAKKNVFSKSIASLSQSEKESKLRELGALTRKEKVVLHTLQVAEEDLNMRMRLLPNIPSDKTPLGKSDKDNVVIKTVGDPPAYTFPVRDYMDLATQHDLIDTERAAKVSGSRFGYIKGNGAILWNALVQYVLEKVTTAGFIPFYSPVLVREEIMRDSGYDSYLEGQEAYHLKDDGLYLVGTGEHALLPYHRNEILDESALPKKYTTYSSCFRREAGTYGKDTKGILRVHQFDKQEMVVFAHPNTSWEIFDELVALQEDIIAGLQIPYHLLEVSTGDLPRPSARVIDLECWIPSEQKYRETHSASNCTDYQARDNAIRYKGSAGTEFVHVLNATAITPRTLIAIIENNQQEDGSIQIPSVLHPYTFGRTVITS